MPIRDTNKLVQETDNRSVSLRSERSDIQRQTEEIDASLEQEAPVFSSITHDRMGLRMPTSSRRSEVSPGEILRQGRAAPETLQDRADFTARAASGTINRGLRAAGHQLAAAPAGIASLATGLAGHERWAEGFAESARDRLERSQRIAPEATLRGVVEGDDNLGDFITGQIGMQLPIMATFIGTGGVGGLAARGSTQAGIRAAQQAARGSTRRISDLQAAQARLNRTGGAPRAPRSTTPQGELRDIGPSPMAQAITAERQQRRADRLYGRQLRRTQALREQLGSAGGAGLAGVPLYSVDASQILIDPEAEGSIQQKAAAASFGAVAATVASLAPTLMLLRNVGLGGQAGHLVGEAARRGAMQRVGVGATKQTIMEGGAEAVAEMSMALAHTWVNDNIDMFDTEHLWRYAEAGTVGGLMGGPAGAATSVRSSDFDNLTDAIGGKIFRAREQGQTEAAINERRRQKELRRLARRAGFEDIPEDGISAQVNTDYLIGRWDAAETHGIGENALRDFGAENISAEQSENMGQMIRLLIDPLAYAEQAGDRTDVEAMQKSVREALVEEYGQERVTAVLDASVIDMEKTLTNLEQKYRQSAHIAETPEQRQKFMELADEFATRLDDLAFTHEDILVGRDTQQAAQRFADQQRLDPQATEIAGQAGEAVEFGTADPAPEQAVRPVFSRDRAATEAISFPKRGFPGINSARSSERLGRVWPTGLDGGMFTGNLMENIVRRRYDDMNLTSEQVEQAVRLDQQIAEAEATGSPDISEFREQRAALDIPVLPFRAIPASEALTQQIRNEFALEGDTIEGNADAQNAYLNEAQQIWENLNQTRSEKTPEGALTKEDITKPESFAEAQAMMEQMTTVVADAPQAAVTGRDESALTDADLEVQPAQPADREQGRRYIIEQERQGSDVQANMERADGTPAHVNLVSLVQTMIPRVDLAATQRSREARQRAGERVQAEGTTTGYISEENVGRALMSGISALYDQGITFGTERPSSIRSLLKLVPESTIVFRRADGAEPVRLRDVLGEGAEVQRAQAQDAVQGDTRRVDQRITRLNKRIANTTDREQLATLRRQLREAESQRERMRGEAAELRERGTVRVPKARRDDGNLKQRTAERNQRIKRLNQRAAQLSAIASRLSKGLKNDRRVTIDPTQVKKLLDSIPESKAADRQFFTDYLTFLKRNKEIQNADGWSAVNKAWANFQNIKGRAMAQRRLNRLDAQRRYEETAFPQSPEQASQAALEEFATEAARNAHELGEHSTRGEPHDLASEQYAQSPDLKVSEQLEALIRATNKLVAADGVWYVNDAGESVRAPNAQVRRDALRKQLKDYKRRLKIAQRFESRGFDNSVVEDVLPPSMREQQQRRLREPMEVTQEMRNKEAEGLQEIADGLFGEGNSEIQVVDSSEAMKLAKGQYDLNKHDGLAFSTVDGNTGKVTTKLWVNEDLNSTASRKGVLLHEFGHAVVDQLAFRLSDKQAGEIFTAYEKWLKKNNKPERNVADLEKSKRSLLNMLNLRKDPRSTKLKDVTPEQQANHLAFKEWLADNAGRWVETNKRPRSAVQKFFKDIATALKALAERFGITGRPAQAVNRVLNNLWDNKAPLDPVRNYYLWSRLENVRSKDSQRKLGEDLKGAIEEVKRQIGDDSAFSQSPGGPLQVAKAVYHSASDPFSIEAFIADRDLVVAKLTSQERYALAKALNRPLVRRQIIDVLREAGRDPDMFLADPHNAIAVGYQMWLAGSIQLTPQGNQLYQGIADMTRAVLARMRSSDQAVAIFEAMAQDKVAARKSLLQEAAPEGSSLQRGAYTLALGELRHVPNVIQEAQRLQKTENLSRADALKEALSTDTVFARQPRNRRQHILRDLVDDVYNKAFIDNFYHVSDFHVAGTDVVSFIPELKRNGVQQVVNDMYDSFFGMQGMMRNFFITRGFIGEAMRARWTNNEAIVQFMNTVFTDVTSEGRGESYLASRERQRGRWDDQWNRIVDKLEPKQQEQARDVLLGIKQASDKDITPAVRQAVQDTYKLLRRVRNYGEGHGLAMGDRGGDYFPWVFDPGTVERQSNQLFENWTQDKFRNDWFKLYKKTNRDRVQQGQDDFVSDSDYEAFVRSYISSLATERNGLADMESRPQQEELDPSPYVNAMNTRELAFIKDKGDAQDNQLLGQMFAKDINATVAVYIDQMTKRAEYTRRFGLKGEKFENMVNQAIEFGASREDIQLMRNMLHSAMGTVGLEVSPFWKSTLAPINNMLKSKPILDKQNRPFKNRTEAKRELAKLKTGGVIVEHKDGFAIQRDLTADPRRFRQLQGAMVVYQNFRMLAFAAFTNMADIAGIAVRTGDFSIAFDAYKQGIRQVWRSLRQTGIPAAEKRKRRTELERLAEELGVVVQSNTNDILGQFYGGNMMSGKARRWNSAFFRWNGMEYLTRNTRMMAVASSRAFIAQHTRRALDGDKTSQRLLKEIDLNVNDVAVRNGELALLDREQLETMMDEAGVASASVARDNAVNNAAFAKMPEGDAKRKQALLREIARDDKVRQALYRMVDESTLRPSSAQRPTWMNDPNWQLFSHLKGFMYTYHERPLRRAYARLQEGQLSPTLMLSTYVGVMMAMDLLREWVQWGFGGAPHKAGWGFADRLTDGVHRSGIYGIGNYVPDALKTREMGRSVTAQLGGPAVSQVEQMARAMFGNGRMDIAMKRALPASQVLDALNSRGWAQPTGWAAPQLYSELGSQELLDAPGVIPDRRMLLDRELY